MEAPQTTTWEQSSSLLTTGLSPHFVVGALVQLLRDNFSTSQNIQLPELRAYTWSPDLSATRILIEDVLRYTPQNLGQRPALLVRRNAFQVQNILLGGGGAFTTPETVTQGVEYQVAWSGSVTVFAVGRTGGEAEQLGHEAGAFLRQFGMLIRAKLGLLRFQHLETGAAGKLKESREHFAVPQTFGISYWETWRLSEESPILKRFTIQTPTDE